MPIRFRCAYCNQLLGISRRKAGQVVRCPTCAGQVVVPTPEEGSGPPEPETTPAGNAGQPQLFEHSDFDELFSAPPSEVMPQSPPVPPSVTAGARAVAWETQGEQAADPDRVQALPSPAPAPAPAPLPRPGIVLSPARATILTVLAIVLVALAFGAGLLVGLSFHSNPHEAEHVGRSAVLFLHS